MDTIKKIRESNKLKQKIKTLFNVRENFAQQVLDEIVEISLENKNRISVKTILNYSEEDIDSIFNKIEKNNLEKLNDIFETSKDIYILTSNEEIYKIGSQ